LRRCFGASDYREIKGSLRRMGVWRIISDFFEKYQWMTTSIHQGRDLLPSPGGFELDHEYEVWRRSDRDFLDRLRQLVARTGFERLRQEVQRVGWADNFRQ
jgi:hypothetical protein